MNKKKVLIIVGTFLAIGILLLIIYLVNKKDILECSSSNGNTVYLYEYKKDEIKRFTIKSKTTFENENYTDAEINKTVDNFVRNYEELGFEVKHEIKDKILYMEISIDGKVASNDNILPTNKITKEDLIKEQEKNGYRCK